ncbi:MAG: hypothetical protein HWE07_13365 [Cytophagia bacterium]|nr:hypothetical protein [Cytophagia bacterium]
MVELSESLKKCRVEGNTLFLPPISEGPLTNYQEVRRVLLKAGAKYKKNAFVFSTSAKPIIDRIIGGENVNPKKEFQFFRTPDDIADRLVELAEIQRTDEICEPSAGDGSIVKAIQRATWPGRVVYGFEINMEMYDTLDRIPGFRLLGYNFLGEYKTTFDKIIANPPFSKNQDIDHIKRMYDVLLYGGRLVSVASVHWQFSGNSKEVNFRKWLKDVKAEIIPLEKDTFAESGTSVAACIIVIDKNA